MIALLNLSVLGFSFVVVFHDKAKRTQQGNLLAFAISLVVRGGSCWCRSRLLKIRHLISIWHSVEIASFKSNRAIESAKFFSNSIALEVSWHRLFTCILCCHYGYICDYIWYFYMRSSYLRCRATPKYKENKEGVMVRHRWKWIKQFRYYIYNILWIVIFCPRWGSRTFTKTSRVAKFEWEFKRKYLKEAITKKGAVTKKRE